MEKNNIVITGGAGFIGTQVAHALDLAGYNVTIVDREFKHRNLPGILVEDDYVNFFRVNTRKYDAVIHLAADHQVEKSVSNPSKYYTNNVIGMKTFLDCLVATEIPTVIFSSSASVYGRQGTANQPLTENLLYDPENAYASTKVAGEMLIKDYARAYGLNYVIFRYFNAAGADPQARAGYVQRPASHVIPILCNKILKGETFSLYGDDYDTPDGSCVRDYVHVDDIASAHVAALSYLEAGGASDVFNIGGKTSTSLKKLVETAARVLEKEPVIEICPRRAGDSSSLIADINKARSVLAWSPKYNIEQIIQHAWAWEKKNEKLI